MTTHILGSTADYLQPAQMKRIDIDGHAVLVIRDREGAYHAMGAVCSHDGAPLEDGLLHEHAVMCPWCHSSFDIRCGVRNQPPAIADVPSYQLEMDDSGQLVLTLQAAPTRRAFNNRASHDLTVVIVGGGAGGHAAALELRRSGFRGRVVILTAASSPPVDRTMLSKQYMAGTMNDTQVTLHNRRWYRQQEIELITHAEVTDVEPSEGLVRFRDEVGSEALLYYDRLILAMGSHPHTLQNTPPLDNVFTLRSLSDARRIAALAKTAKRAVVVGASFTGIEVALALREHGMEVTILEQRRGLYRDSFGDDIGKMLLDHHLHVNGLTIHRGQSVRRVMHRDGRMTALELNDWRTIEADFAVVAVGVAPRTGFMQKSSILLAEDGGVLVDKQLRTNAPDVYAVGDIATYENRVGERERSERWRTAQQQGVLAAHNIMGGEETIDSIIPFFWTEQGSGLRLGYVGHVRKWDTIVYRGSVQGKHFLAMYIKDNRLRAASSIGYDRDLMALEVIMRERLPLTRMQMQDENFDLAQYAQTTIKRVEMPREF
ncbi:MAG: FAD-dependent oxidoreductase [Chloroflexota bacterium]